MGTKELRV